MKKFVMRDFVEADVVLVSFHFFFSDAYRKWFDAEVYSDVNVIDHKKKKKHKKEAAKRKAAQDNNKRERALYKTQFLRDPPHDFGMFCVGWTDQYSSDIIYT